MRVAAEPAHASPSESRHALPALGFEGGLVKRWAARILGHLPAALPAIAILLVGSAILAEVWYAISHVGYVLYVGAVLRRISRRGAPDDLAVREGEWSRFRRHVSWVMDNDVSAFIALSIVTRATIDLPGPGLVWIVAGVLLCLIGLGVKAWATASLPPGAYYWRNFFFPSERVHVSSAGPYRWLSDPMYSVGYLPSYGFALMMCSLPGLIAAVGAQVLILLLAALVERRVLAHQ